MAGSTLVLSPSLTRAPHEESRALSISRGIGPADDEIQILLATPSVDRPYVPLRVFTSDSIQSVKMQIARSHGFTLSSQVSGIRLVSGGRELRAREHADLAGYGISRSGEVLHLALRLSDLVDVRVQTREGVEKTFTLEKGARVWDLKQKIAKDEQALDADDAQLVLRGQPLQEGLLVEDLALSEDIVVHLLVRKSSKVRVKQGKGQHVELSIESSRTFPKELSQKKRLPSAKPSLCITPLVSLASSRDRTSLLDLIVKAAAGLPVHPPVLSLGGMGAAYFLADRSGETVAVFKPVDEEPLAVNNPRGLPVSKTGEGLKRGTRVGEGAAREVAAFLLDKDGFASVPPTAMVSCTHPSFHYSHKQTSLLCEKGACNRKVGSLQQFVPCVSNCEDTGPQSLPVAEVHKISVLDIRLANADRSGENILICRNKDGSTKLVPIDHGYCLPESMEDVWFDWIYWPQSKVPYSAEVKAYVANLNVEEDLSLLAANGIHLSEKSERVLQASTLLLKKGVARGLTAHEIASLMCRMDLNKESALEGMLSQAEEALLPGCSLEAFVETLGSIMDEALEAF